MVRNPLTKGIERLRPLSELIDRSFLSIIGLESLEELAQRGMHRFNSLAEKNKGNMQRMQLPDSPPKASQSSPLCNCLTVMFLAVEQLGWSQEEAMGYILPEYSIFHYRLTGEYQTLLNLRPSSIAFELSNSDELGNSVWREPKWDLFTTIADMEPHAIMGFEVDEHEANQLFLQEAPNTPLGDSKFGIEAVKKFTTVEENLSVSPFEALMLYGLNLHAFSFDIRALMLNDFPTQRLGRAIESQLQQALKLDIPLTGLIGFLKDKRNLRLFAEEKARYLEERKVELEKRVYFSCAVELYGLNLIHTIETLPIFYEAKSLMCAIQACEFRDYYDANDFKGYVDAITLKRDIGTMLRKPFLRLAMEFGKERPFLDYVMIFTAPKARTQKQVRVYASDSFLELWTKGHEKGWGLRLQKSLEFLDDVLVSPELSEVLAEQPTGSLLKLLRDADFRDFFIRTGYTLDYETLAKLAHLDEALLRRVTPHVTERNSGFVRNLVALLKQHRGYDSSSIPIEPCTINFLSDMDNAGNPTAMLDLLRDYSVVMRALDAGLFQRPQNPADKEALASWWQQNREAALETTAAHDTIKQYIKDPEDGAQRKSLESLYRDHSTTFFRQHIERLLDLPEHAYSRTVQFLATLKAPKELLRKNDSFTLLKAMATAPPSAWEEFCGDVRKADAKKDFSHLGEKSRYGNVLANQRLYTRLSSLSDLFGFSVALQEGIGRLIETGQHDVAEEFMRAAEEGAVALRTLTQVLPLYNTIDDIWATPLESWMPRSGTEPVATPATAPGEYNYSQMDAYCSRAGFEPRQVRAVIEFGFSLRTPHHNLGESYIPPQYVMKSVSSHIEGTDRSRFRLTAIINWLVNEGVVRVKKAKTAAKGVVSIEPHQTGDTPLSQYVQYVLANRYNL